MSKNEKATPARPVDNKTAVKKPGGLKKPSAASNTKEASWSFKILSLLVIFIGGALASVYFLPELKARLPIIADWVGESDNGDIAAINQRITDQQAEIETLKQTSLEQESLLSQLSTSPGGDIPADLIVRIEALELSLGNFPEDVIEPEDNSQSARIDMLLSRMSQLEASFIPLSRNMLDVASAEKKRQSLGEENASLSAKIDGLESRLLNVETIAAIDNSGLLINLKIAEIKRKVLSGALYDIELNALTRRLEGSGAITNVRFKASLDYLAENAATGLMTPDQLRNDFNQLIPQLLSISDISPSGSWWQNMLNSLGNLITIRKTDGTSYNENGLDGAISTIENLLERGDIKSALDTVQTLPNAARTVLANWTEGANSWTLSMVALNDLEILAAERYLGADTQ